MPGKRQTSKPDPAWNAFLGRAMSSEPMHQSIQQHQDIEAGVILELASGW